MSESRKESISASVYQDLLALTFLCGRGIPLPELMCRFLGVMREDVPADGLWVHQDGAVLASAGEDPPRVAPPVPPPVPTPLDHGPLLVVHVARGVTLAARPRPGHDERAREVMTLFGRIIALAWQVELAAQAAVPPLDWREARAVAEERWLRHLLGTQPSIAEAARVGGVSRMHLYTLMRRYRIDP